VVGQGWVEDGRRQHCMIIHSTREIVSLRTIVVRADDNEHH